jgi:L-aspartate oxidase
LPSTELNTTAVRSLMWQSVGLFRERTALEGAVEQLEAATSRVQAALSGSESACADDWRRFNLLTVARLIARAALRREESRGGHFRADFPSRDDLHWKVHLMDARHDEAHLKQD